MDDQSSRSLTDGSLETVEASPMSNIVKDLCRSSLNSSGANKRHFQFFRDVSDARYPTTSSSTSNVHGNKGLFQNVRMKNICSSTTTSTDLIFGLNPQSNSDQLLKCDKENNSATNLSYNSNLQNVRYKKVRCYPLQDRHMNKQNNGMYETELVKVEQEQEMQCDTTTASRRMSTESRYSAVLSPQSMVSSNSRSSLSSRLDATDSGESVLLRRLSSGYESMDDALMSDLIDMEAMDDEMQLPSDISKLLSGDIVAPETLVECDVSTTPKFSKVSAKVRWLPNRCLQNQIRGSTVTSPPMSKIRTCLFRSPTATCSPKVIRNERSSPRERIYYIGGDSPLSNRAACKRPSEEPDGKVILKKSRKSHSFCIDATTADPEPAIPSPLANSKANLQRSLSENEANIKWAVHRSITDTDLIGDFSKPCVLPLTNGNHMDLKNITADTLAALLRDEFVDRVDSYTIVDCRYPYEYHAGHIRGALNLYNRDLVEQTLLEPMSEMVPQIQPDVSKRHVLVFHCEFSLERGPNLSRFLRSLDRQRNKEHYPALYYPEIYLLNGGYERFYKEQREFCSPQNYKPMKHPDHTEECKLFRSKSKSWQGDKSKGGNPMQGRNLKRLGF